MVRDCCSPRGFSGVGAAVRVLHSSAVKFAVRRSAPVATGLRSRLYPLLARRWRLLHQRRQEGCTSISTRITAWCGPHGYSSQNYANKNGCSCSDDVLDIKSDRSDTAWTDLSTGIRYKLRLWGFVNNGRSDNCQAHLSKAESAGLEECFIIRERAIFYGCLYGSPEQPDSVNPQR